jgi:prefoldin subunit 5
MSPELSSGDIDSNNYPNHHHHHTPNTKNLEKVIKSLEDEFESLTTQYRQILATMQKDPDVSRPGLPESSLRNSERLISVVQQLQRKGEQLRALKG